MEIQSLAHKFTPCWLPLGIYNIAGTYLIKEVVPVEGSPEGETALDLEDFLDVGQHMAGGGGCEAQDGHAWELLLHDAQELVVLEDQD